MNVLIHALFQSFLLIVGPTGPNPPKPGIFLNAAIHAREWVRSVATLFVYIPCHHAHVGDCFRPPSRRVQFIVSHWQRCVYVYVYTPATTVRQRLFPTAMYALLSVTTSDLFPTAESMCSVYRVVLTTRACVEFCDEYIDMYVFPSTVCALAKFGTLLIFRQTAMGVERYDVFSVQHSILPPTVLYYRFSLPVTNVLEPPMVTALSRYVRVY